MEDIIVILILIVIVVSILWYLSNAKKRGETCIGCPYSKQCGGNCNSHNHKIKDVRNNNI
ncbi:MAG: hypothetical protein GX935_07415 [Erysipelotrichia bacterium]|nr:hypothetical protein [Erysipelotrichia bacterium]